MCVRTPSNRERDFLGVSIERKSFFLFPEFHELWCTVMSICLFTEVRPQWAMFVLG